MVISGSDKGKIGTVIKVITSNYQKSVIGNLIEF